VVRRNARECACRCGMLRVVVFRSAMQSEVVAWFVTACVCVWGGGGTDRHSYTHGKGRNYTAGRLSGVIIGTSAAQHHQDVIHTVL
jgi:hypothetical protein